eukprot:5008324-Prymnesium_polylepis.1
MANRTTIFRKAQRACSATDLMRMLLKIGSVLHKKAWRLTPASCNRFRAPISSRSSNSTP